MLFLGFSCGLTLHNCAFSCFYNRSMRSIPPNSLIRSLGINTTSSLGAFSIAVIGLFNIIGAITAGYLGKTLQKNIYFNLYRTLASIFFIMTPMTVETGYYFLLLWAVRLATVPLTSGVIGYITGYTGTLYE